MNRVLVVGGGGREHALLRALMRSPQHPELLAAPGNGGMCRDKIECLDIDAGDVDALAAAAREREVALVVVGPEAPLVAGLVDRLAEAGIAAFGPTAAAARIEGSKSYAKDLMNAVGVPTARHTVVSSRRAAAREIKKLGLPVVLKADVLAAGKGVAVCADDDAVHAALDELFVSERFGKTEVLVEEFLTGSELSLLALCDGERALPMAPARDYKRIFDGDEGPNTGGMGSYSPVPGFGADHAEVLARAVHQPIVDELRRRGTPFHGVLYAGLMMTSAGPRVLEYNCRFGDPETQAVLPRLRTDLLDLMQRATRPGGLAGVRLEWSSASAVTLVLASAGYPESSSSGEEITGLESVDSLDTEVLHAATKEVEGGFVTAGGRVLNVTGIADTMEAARDRAYAAADRIEFEGKQMRRDIAARAVRERGAA